MKYDCCKTLDYAHERKRMCDNTVKDGDCDKCQLQGVGGNCYNTRSITQEHIDIVQKWSDEHPEKTRADVFFDIFPKSCRWGDIPAYCFKHLIGKTCQRTYESCAECWGEPYNGEFGEARGEEDD